MQEKLIYFQKMTSCKLRVKLRVTFSELFVEEYRKNRLMGRSVARCVSRSTCNDARETTQKIKQIPNESLILS